MKKFSIKKSEFAQRSENIRKLMAENNIDTFLAFSTESEPFAVRYLSDYWPSFETAAVLIHADRPETLIIGPESLTYASGRSQIDRIIQMRDFRESSQPDYPGSKLPVWSDIFSELKTKRLAIAGWHMFPQTIYADMCAALPPDAEIVPGDELFRQVCIKKSEAELECLREAARITELGFKNVLENIKVGMTEAQIAGLAVSAMLANGAESTAYPVWCCSGENSRGAISRPTMREVKRSEIIHLSIGAKVAGYCASIGRPIVLGKCPDDLKKFLQVGLDAENMTIDLMCGGTGASEVAKKVHGWIRSQGYGDCILYGPAHGCGQMECEWPFLETSSTFTLGKNMTFMVDVFLADKKQGFRWEDGVIIRDGAPEELSNYARQLNILDL